MKKQLIAAVCGFALSFGSVAHADDTPLAEKMDEAGGALKLLRRAKSNEEAIKLVRQAQTELLASIAYIPELVEAMPDGAAKEVEIIEYKKMIADSYKALCDLEIAYLSDDQDKIDDAMSAVKASRKKGHQRFIEE